MKAWRRRGKTPHKFQFSIAVSSCQVETHSKTWKPEALQVTWTRGGRLAQTAPAPLENGRVSFTGEAMSMVITLYKEKGPAQFDAKEYKLTLQEVKRTPGTNKVTKTKLAQGTVDLGRLGNLEGVVGQATVPLKSANTKLVERASLAIVVKCVFLHEGEESADDGLSEMSAVSFHDDDHKALHDAASSHGDDDYQKETLAALDHSDDDDNNDDEGGGVGGSHSERLHHGAHSDEESSAGGGGGEGSSKGGLRGSGTPGGSGSSHRILSPSRTLDNFLNNSNQNVGSAIEARSSSLSALQTALDRANDDKALLEKEVKDIRTSLRNALNENTTLSERAAALLAELERERLKVAQLNADLSHAQGNVDDITQQWEDALATVEQYKDQLDSMRKELHANKDETMRALKEMSKLSSDMKELEDELTAEIQANEDAEAAAAEKTKAVEILLAASEDKNRVQLERIRALESDLDYAEVSLAQALKQGASSAEAEDLRRELAKAKRLRDDFVVQWEKEKEEWARSLADAKAEAAGDRAKSAAELSSLRQSLSTAQREAVEALEDLARVKKDATSTVEGLLAEIEEHKFANRKVSKKIELLEAAAARAKEAEMAALEADASAQAKLEVSLAARLSEDKAALAAEVDSLEAALQVSRAETKALQSELNIMSAQLDALGGQLEMANFGNNTEMEKLRKEIRKFEHDYKTLDKKYSSLKKENKGLTEKVSSLETLIAAERTMDTVSAGGAVTKEGTPMSPNTEVNRERSSALQSLLDLALKERDQARNELQQFAEHLITAKVALATSEFDREEAKKKAKDTAKALAKAKLSQMELAEKVTALEVRLASAKM